MSWLTTILPPLCIVLAAICKAMADTMDHHFDTSIFRNKPRYIWDPNQVHRKVRMIAGYPMDAWHIVNTVQLGCWLLLPLVYRPLLPSKWMDYGAGGLIFILVFNTFYNKIFKR